MARRSAYQGAAVHEPKVKMCVSLRGTKSPSIGLLSSGTAFCKVTELHPMPLGWVWVVFRIRNIIPHQYQILLCSCYWIQSNPHSNRPTFSVKPSQNSRGCNCNKGATSRWETEQVSTKCQTRQNKKVCLLLPLCRYPVSPIASRFRMTHTLF